MKLSACLIVRDEALTLRACLMSIRDHVDELVVVDTGSLDATPDIAKELADVFETFTDCNDLQGRITDFSMARNRALDLATGDAVFWCDGDDVVQGAEHLRGLVQEAGPGPWMRLMPYEYAYSADGKCTVLHDRERLVAPRTAFRWAGPVHEGLMPQGAAAGSLETARTELVVVKHRAQAVGKPRDPQRNLRILADYVAKNGEGDHRALHYLAKEHLLSGNVGQALHYFRRHFELDAWTDQKCLSALELARCYQTMGDHHAAVEWALRALVTKSWPEPYWVMGRSFCCLAELGIDPDYNYRRAAHQFQLGFKVDPGEPYTVLFSNPTERHEVHAWLSVALSRIGDLDGAIASAQAGLEVLPTHPEMVSNLAVYRKQRAQRNASSAVAELVELQALPPEARVIVDATLRGEFAIQRIQPETFTRFGKEQQGHLDWQNQISAAQQAPQKSEREHIRDFYCARSKVDPSEPLTGVRVEKTASLRISIWVGHQLEPWTPETLMANGMGGSETMAWEMARRLAKMGHTVNVYGHTHNVLEVFEGVDWRDASEFEGTTHDVLIVSRQAAAVDIPHTAKVRLLWVHDVHCGEALTAARALKYDRIMCLSQWHADYFKSCYPTLTTPIVVTRNGIELKRFKRSGARWPFAIYSSSPDRGLPTALDAWPAVRKAVPDAELHVFYGFDNWRKSAELMSDKAALASIDRMEQQAKTTVGVVMRGRVSGAELAAAMCRASVWAYPTWFTETSCITAMEAQAAGLHIVTSPIAALKETVIDDEASWIGGDWRSRSYLEAFTEAVIEKLRSPEPRNVDVSRFSLDTLAADWHKLLTELVESDAIVPAFQEVRVAS